MIPKFNENATLKARTPCEPAFTHLHSDSFITLDPICPTSKRIENKFLFYFKLNKIYKVTINRN